MELWINRVRINRSWPVSDKNYLLISTCERISVITQNREFLAKNASPGNGTSHGGPRTSGKCLPRFPPPSPTKDRELLTEDFVKGTGYCLVTFIVQSWLLRKVLTRMKLQMYRFLPYHSGCWGQNNILLHIISRNWQYKDLYSKEQKINNMFSSLKLITEVSIMFTSS